jgi:hypothetical protein
VALVSAPVRRHRRLLFATLLAISFLAGSLSTIVAVSITGGWYERVNIGQLGACEELLDAWLRVGWTQWQLPGNPCALQRPRFRLLEWADNQWHQFRMQGPIEQIVAPALLIVLVFLILLARALWRIGSR